MRPEVKFWFEAMHLSVNSVKPIHWSSAVVCSPPSDGARGFSSVISSSGSEWVIFNAAQVLPCYVIEVMDVGANLHNPVPPPLSGLTGGQEQGEESGGAKKARLEARVRRTREVLPLVPERLHAEVSIRTAREGGVEVSGRCGSISWWSKEEWSKEEEGEGVTDHVGPSPGGQRGKGVKV